MFCIIQPFQVKTFDVVHKSETWTGPQKMIFQNPLAVLQHLMSNPLFKNEMVFKAEKHFSSHRVREYAEIHWSNFWWEIQVEITELQLVEIHGNHRMYSLYSRDVEQTLIRCDSSSDIIRNRPNTLQPSRMY